ncbi:MAG: SIS domain-containing protein [Patescibacteria group bacterium]|nr:SIS domain-containing protein [Patescibacteria group bacterium]MDD4610563.1 SIS domain-containing protein [Patescibacteria group bacterium]
MLNLNDLKQFKKLDTERVSESIELLPDQIRQVLDEEHLIKIPREYSQINKVVVNGMGGSNLGARIIKAVFNEQLKSPIIIAPGYEVPNFVDKNTLFLISSYSGTTEEPLSVYKEVKKRGAKIIAFTTDNPKSKLKDLMLRDNIPGYIAKPEFNPSNQPRLGIGYSMFGIMILLAKAGLFKINPKEIKEIIANLEIWDRELRPTAKINNQAKKIATQIYGREPIIIAAEFLDGNSHVLRNQFCENSKNFASYLSLPELNHYTMEGLSNPKTNKNNLIFFFVNSNLCHPRIQKRSNLTKQVIKKNGVKTSEYTLKGTNKLMQSFEFLQIGSWITYYLGMLNGVDPVKIPWVDWFKKELDK